MPRQKLLIAISALILTCLSGGAAPVRPSGTWRVLVRSVPLGLRPSDASSLQAAYVLKQTHLALFQRLKNGDYNSALLSDWSRSLNSSQFSFCLKQPLAFDAQHSFAVEDLRHLIEVTAEKRSIKASSVSFSRSAHGDCVALRFLRPANHLLFDLSKIENAPTLPTTDSRVDLGLGMYRVKRFTEHEVVLQAKSKREHHFSEIQFLDVAAVSALALQNEHFDDYNYISESLRPTWLENERMPYLVTPFQSVGVVINVSDPSIRRRIFDCIDIEALRAAIFEGRKMFLDISSVLPIGVPGARPGRLARVCENLAHASFVKGADTKPLLFPIWNVRGSAEIDHLISLLSERAGVAIEVKHVEFNDYLKHFYGKNEGFDLIVVGLDTQREEYAPFFEIFAANEKKVIKVQDAELDRLFLKLNRAETESEEREIAVDLQNRVLDQHLFLPLFQLKKFFYYSPSLKNIMMGFDYLNFPDIGRIEYP